MDSATPQPLYPQERDPIPTVQETGWVPVPVWTGAGNLAATGFRSPDCPACSVVDTTDLAIPDRVLVSTCAVYAVNNVTALSKDG